MSLRLRLFIVVGLALAALLVVALALRDILSDSRAGTVAMIAADTRAAVVALARAVKDAPPPAPRTPELRSKIRTLAADVLEPLIETRGGYCYRDGDFIEAESGSFRHHGHGPRHAPEDPPPPPPRPGEEDRHDPRHAPGPPPPPSSSEGEDRGPPGPPPDVRDALIAACQRAGLDRIERQDVANHGKLTVLSVTGVTDDIAAFAMRIVPAPPRRTGLSSGWVLAAMPLVTLITIAVMVDTIVAWRRGMRDIRSTLVRLEEDLHADIPRPRAKELAEIADQLRTMANRLAGARERERALERRVAHQARLGSLGRLVAGVAHEIRNPLTGIKLLLDGMRRRRLDERSERDVHTCLREIARLNDIVTSFLGIARHAQAEPASIDLGALVDERAEAVAGLAGARGVRVVRAGDGAVLAERNVIVQVLDNLLRNAIEASPAGAEIDVAVRSGGDHAEIDVIDRGDGIPGELADNLFEPFVTSKPGGTGLGLWLSLTLATSRGGNLRYRRDGGRTHFTLTVPVEPR